MKPLIDVKYQMTCIPFQTVHECYFMLIKGSLVLIFFKILQSWKNILIVSSELILLLVFKLSGEELNFVFLSVTPKMSEVLKMCFCLCPNCKNVL